MSNLDCDAISIVTSSEDSLTAPEVKLITTSPGRGSTCSAMSASSEDTSDSGFYNLTPDVCNVNPDVNSQRLSPRPSPRAIRRLSGTTESNDGEDIDFFLKVVSEFRDYVSEKIEGLGEQHQMNESCLHELQQTLKDAEESWSEHEVKLVKDINHMVALVHKQQGIFMEKIKKHRSKETDILREKMDVCRRNMKIITGVLSFARRVQNEKDDSIREQTLKELKQRFTLASERMLPIVEGPDVTTEELKLDEIEEMTSYIEDKVLGSSNHSSPKRRCNKPPFILAQTSPSDVTRNSILVRWTDTEEGEDVSYEVFWEFLQDRKIVKRNVADVKKNYYTIRDLRPNCDVTVRVRRHHQTYSTEQSQPAFFKTNPQPAKFKLDSDTAHSKLKLSSDMFSVHYPGESKSLVQKSPSRFTFALNVLGNIAFFTGRHYWEVQVNEDGWAVGVAYRNVPRNSWLGSNETSWILHYNPSKREYKVRHAGESADINYNRDEKKKLERIGVYIDYEAGIISFIDCHCKEILYTFHTTEFEVPICAAVNPFYHGGYLTVISGLEIPDINFNV